MGYLRVTSLNVPDAYEVLCSNGWAHFKTPWFENEFHYEIKYAAIPWSEKRFDYPTKTWSVKLDHLEYFRERIAYWYQCETDVREA